MSSNYELLLFLRQLNYKFNLCQVNYISMAEPNQYQNKRKEKNFFKSEVFCIFFLLVFQETNFKIYSVILKKKINN